MWHLQLCQQSIIIYYDYCYAEWQVNSEHMKCDIESVTCGVLTEHIPINKLAIDEFMNGKPNRMNNNKSMANNGKLKLKICVDTQKSLQLRNQLLD